MTDDWMQRVFSEDAATPEHEDDAAPAPLTPMAAKREALVAQFAAWLDTFLEDEPLPGGTAGELLDAVQGTPLDMDQEPCDQFAMWSSLTTLAQEVKLQGRAFKDLTTTMQPFQDVAQVLETLDPKEENSVIRQALDALESSRTDLERTAAEAAWREVVDFLLDLRDRLCRNAETLRGSLDELRQSHGPQRLPRWLPRVRKTVDQLFAATDALETGNGMLLERLDEALLRLGVQETRCEGCIFDPGTMKAVEVERRSDMPDGTVFDVHRRGYTWRGKIYRLAEVKVVRNPAPESTMPTEVGGESQE